MRKFSILAAGAMALSATGALANAAAPSPMLAPLTYATPELGWFKGPNPVGMASSDIQLAQAYSAEREQLLRKYLALEESNGGALSPADREAMLEDIADLKARYAIP